jgi:nicotinate-nucleotide adenylyltransferase
VIPAAVPPLRSQPVADATHRAAMVRLAIEGSPGLVCDTREIDRDGTSYTVHTLEEMRRDLPESRLLLILGRDAFDRLPKWCRFEDIRRLADILVVNRPGFDIASRIPDWLDGESIASRLDPLAPPGRILALEIPPTDISATTLRRRLAAKEDVGDVLPARVLSYIKVNRLYA